MVIENYADAAVLNYKTKLANSTRWDLANQTLYDLCKNYPDHRDADQIVAKLWLIGRSYAAAIERRKNAKGYKGDFYYDTVAPSILLIGATLDSNIANLKSNANIDDLLDTHAFLMSIFKSLTGMDMRSLASKYLHFHCPDSVYIYDSVASKALRKMVKKPKNISMYLTGNRDAEYVDFCMRAGELQQYIEDKYALKLTVRELDTLLLNA